VNYERNKKGARFFETQCICSVCIFPKASSTVKQPFSISPSITIYQTLVHLQAFGKWQLIVWWSCINVHMPIHI